MNASDGAVALTSKTIGDLNNGFAAAAIDHAIGQAIRDTEDRGKEDKKVRRVTIQLTFQKVTDNNIAVECAVKASTPDYVTGKTMTQVSYSAGDPKKGPGLLFQSECAERPDQPALPYDRPNEKG